MRRLSTSCRLILLVAVTTGLFVTISQAQTKRATTARAARIMVPEGTVIPVTLDKALSSATNHKGDRFTATVRSSQDGDAEFPRGTKIEGVVTEALKAGKGQPGMLDLDPQVMLLPDGQRIRAVGSLTALDEKNVTLTNGRLTAKGKKGNDRLKFIAIGAGGGFIIGKLTKNTLLGTLLGGAAGYFYGDSRKAKATDVMVSEGTEFGVRLDREVAFQPTRAFVVARENFRYGAPGDFRSRNSDFGADPSAIDNRQSAIKVTLDGRMVSFDNNPPIAERGNILVPLAPVMEAARLRYDYDERQQTVRIEDTDEGDLYLQIGKPYALLEGERENLEAPAQVRDGEVFVPLRFLALATGMGVVWNAKTRTAMMTTSTPVAASSTRNRSSDIGVSMDGRTISFGNHQPFAERGNVLVPLAPILDEAQLGYHYNQQRQTVRMDNGMLYMKIGQPYALLQGERENLEAPAQVRSGKVFVPLHFLALATGMHVVWNANTRNVIMTSTATSRR